MEFQAKFYDKILIIYLAGPVSAADIMELQILIAKDGTKAGTLLLYVETAVFDAPANEALRLLKSQSTKKQNGPTKCLIVSPTLADADHKNLIDALDALKNQDALRIVDLFTKEKIFKDLKAKAVIEQNRAYELLSVPPGNMEQFTPTLERLKLKVESLENEYRVITKDIALLQDQRKKSKQSSVSADKVDPEHLAKLNKLKEDICRKLSETGVIS